MFVCGPQMLHKFKIKLHSIGFFWTPTTNVTPCYLQLRSQCNFKPAFWCSFWISFRVWSTSEFLCGMLKTLLRSSCLSGLDAWCQHSWVYSKACAHKLAADVSIRTARQFPEMYWHFTWFWLVQSAYLQLSFFFPLVWFSLTDVRQFVCFVPSLHP